MTKKEEKFFNLKVRFNDVMLRELGLDITDESYVCDSENETVIQIKGRFIKYNEDPYAICKHNEIDLNLLENPRLTETLSIPVITGYCNRKGYILQSLNQVPIDGTNKGIFVISYIENGEVKELKSDGFINESVRIFNLLCKLNKSERLYKFSDFDIEIVRRK